MRQDHVQIVTYCRESIVVEYFNIRLHLVDFHPGVTQRIRAKFRLTTRPSVSDVAPRYNDGALSGICLATVRSNIKSALEGINTSESFNVPKKRERKLINERTHSAADTYLLCKSAKVPEVGQGRGPPARNVGAGSSGARADSAAHDRSLHRYRVNLFEVATDTLYRQHGRRPPAARQHRAGSAQSGMLMRWGDPARVYPADIAGSIAR
ncbi:hypothetical protein EVAR_53023_1 [Eumeta japonica]|uniref:Uncharacterized protein n=1 Tax=Eumeta variegata TaxID=151549 RepID=A0A4C1XPM4_EUMVA|nr:hypothetical protein EVAR_53023_1 [Eumeta japonica]